jgi:hypothetical protein
LRLTPHDFSPSVLGKVVRAAAREPSFREAAEAVADLAEVSISGRQLGRIAEEVGGQLQARRDDHVSRLEAGELEPRVETRPALAVVEVDGGRLQIRGQGEGPGAHQAAWREDKVAILATMANVVSDCDPEPELPDCFRDRAYVEEVIGAIGGSGPLGTPTPGAEWPIEWPVEWPVPVAGGPAGPRRVPELAVRTYVATTRPCDQFGPMVAAEARRRNFAEAYARAFLGDGSAWIWGLQRRHFPTFVAIVDFLHALGHVFAAAKAAAPDVQGRWELFEAWSEACWKGRVGQVIEELRTLRDVQACISGVEPERRADDDPRRIIARVLGYLEDDRERMDYPRYRRQGLPWTTSHVESTVKLFNRRVKGSEKFWSESGAEAMLQVRAAFLAEDGRLERHLKERPCGAFRNYKNRGTREAA